MYHIIYSSRNNKYIIVKVINDYVTGYLRTGSDVTSEFWVQNLTLLTTFYPHKSTKGWNFSERLLDEHIILILSFETTTPLDYVQNIYTLHPELLI